MPVLPFFHEKLRSQQSDVDAKLPSHDGSQELPPNVIPLRRYRDYDPCDAPFICRRQEGPGDPTPWIHAPRIISGGQTGVDRAALDAALDAGAACGGWCPEGREAEDGEIPLRYPVVEIPGAGYRQRTLRNLREADFTVIIFRQPLGGGTLLTANACKWTKRPHLLIDMDAMSAEKAAYEIADQTHSWSAKVLNVAGPRARSCPEAAEFTYTVMRAFLAMRVVPWSHER